MDNICNYCLHSKWYSLSCNTILFLTCLSHHCCESEFRNQLQSFIQLLSYTRHVEAVNYETSNMIYSIIDNFLNMKYLDKYILTIRTGLVITSCTFSKSKPVICTHVPSSSSHIFMHLNQIPLNLRLQFLPPQVILIWKLIQAIQHVHFRVCHYWTPHIVAFL